MFVLKWRRISTILKCARILKDWQPESLYSRWTLTLFLSWESPREKLHFNFFFDQVKLTFYIHLNCLFIMVCCFYIRLNCLLIMKPPEQCMNTTILWVFPKDDYLVGREEQRQKQEQLSFLFCFCFILCFIAVREKRSPDTDIIIFWRNHHAAKEHPILSGCFWLHLPSTQGFAYLCVKYIFIFSSSTVDFVSGMWNNVLGKHCTPTSHTLIWSQAEPLWAEIMESMN